MPTRPFPHVLVALILAIAVVNAFAHYHYWYWTMRWFDMPMHFAGGMWLAGVAIWWRFFSGPVRDCERHGPISNGTGKFTDVRIGLLSLLVWPPHLPSDSSDKKCRSRAKRNLMVGVGVWGAGSALIVGLAWEVYEAVIALATKGHINAMSDTLGDLLFDILGGLVVVCIIYVKLKNQNVK